MARVLWRIIDAKPGHEKQTLGLAQALARHVEVERYDLPAPPRAAAFWQLVRGRFPAGDGLPDPDLILGAGHATHLALLAARRARGGKAICLMRPSLPIGLFDLCLIPEHDDPPAHANVIVTQGVLNAVAPSDRHDPRRGLFLIGGASSHYHWDSAAVAEQVRALVHESPDIHWQLTTSRRTPETFVNYLTAARPDNLTLHPHTKTPPGWLEAALAEAGICWVSEDSVSMLYEALTAGCAVGLMRLPARRHSRIGRGVEQLVAQGWVKPFDAWQRDHLPPVAAPYFNEAERCARLLLSRFACQQNA